MLGGAVGQRMLADEDLGNGESRAADQAIAAAGFPKKTEEQVLVQGQGPRRKCKANLKAAVGDVVKKLEAAPHVVEVESPYAKGNDGQLSRDGRSALVTFKLQGEDDVAKDRVDAALAATAAAQRAHPPAADRAVRRRERRTRRSPRRSTRTSRRPSFSRCRSRC